MKRDGEGPLFKVLNPLGVAKKSTRFEPAARLPGLAGKTVYCVCQVIMGSETVVERVAKALAEYVADVKVVYKRKPAAYMTDESGLWEEVAAGADAVIYGCGV